MSNAGVMRYHNQHPGKGAEFCDGAQRTVEETQAKIVRDGR